MVHMHPNVKPVKIAHAADTEIAYAAATIPRVPNQPKTPNRAIRISDEDWADFRASADASGFDRTKVINQFIRWYLRRPGAKLPERPAPGNTGRSDD